MRFWQPRSLRCCLAAFVLLLCGLPAWAQSQSTQTNGAQAAPAPATISLDTPLKVSGPSPDDLTAGDPSGTKTGSANDVVASDPKKGVTLTDLVNQVGQNRIGINFTWTLVCGFLVMFMQAGFAIVETGLCRAKNANHTMMMNFMVYGFGLFAYWVCGFAIQMGSAAGTAMLGGASPLNGEFAIHLLGHDWGLIGTRGFFLGGATYDVGVMVLFLFQMVFMDTALTIVTGSVAERWKYAAFCVSSIVLGAFTYPLFAHWAWGGGWLAKLGANFGLGAGYADFAGSGVVHSVGAMTALAGALIIGPRIGKYNRDGSANAIPGHDIVIVLTGCFILAFGWFGFNPGSTLGASGALRISTVAVDTMLAGCTGSFGAVLYMWIKYGKPDASMSGNGLLAGLVAITAPSGYVNTRDACIIGIIAGLLVCLSVEFVDRVLRIDDPVGAISVHGACGLFGVVSVGLFADGTNTVKGLFYGDPGQLVAQLIGVVTLLGVIFPITYGVNLLIDIIIGQRVSAEDELEGLDIPEMGALCYPEFVLKHQPVPSGAAAAD
ncbi:MAG: ammonium transporter [Acidobacteria bacterium]|nr:ammonium transporter [Acidobacteriota bacterium]